MCSKTESNYHGFDPALHRSEDVHCRRGFSRDQEREMAGLIAGGDQAARNRMVRAHLGLVVTIAREFQGRGLVLDDLIGEGNLGLIRAADQFNPDFGTWFSTYASYWIKQAIRDALINRTATIRLPAHMVRLLTRWRRTERTLCREADRMPHFEEVASILGLSEVQKSLVREARRAGRLKLEGSSGSGAANRLLDVATDRDGPVEAILQADDERDSLTRRMESLNVRERTVLTLRYGLDAEPLTLSQVGTRLGLCRASVRKIELDAIRKLGSDHYDSGADRCHRSPTARIGMSHRSMEDRSRTGRERHDDLENEPVVSETTRQHEHVEQLMGPEDPRHEDGPVQQVEHRSHAVGQAADHDGQQGTVRHGPRELGIADNDAPAQPKIETGRQHRREVASGRDQNRGRGRHAPDDHQGPPPPSASHQAPGQRGIAARDEGEDSDAVQAGESRDPGGRQPDAVKEGARRIAESQGQAIDK